MFRPIVYQLPKLEDDIFSYNPEIKYSRTLTYPKFSYGFNHFIYSTKDKMEITNNIKMKNKKFYYVVNPYEHKIDNYDKSLINVTPDYLDIKKSGKPDVLSRAFYKLWELIFMFDLVPKDDSDFTSVHLAEGPGSFIQAVMYHRDKFSDKKNTKKDRFFGITLHRENPEVPEMEKNFLSYFKKQNPQKFILHQTVDKKTAEKSNKDNGDITKIKTINNLYNSVKKGKLADLITADGGFPWKNENLQEQEAYRLLFGEMLAALRLQEKGGSFVIKFFESFTDVTIKLINIMQHFYDNVFITKPMTSRESNSEKYIVCTGFDKPKDYDKKIKILEKMLEQANKKEENDGLYLNDIFPDFKLSENLLQVVIASNLEITNRQCVMINKITSYIKGSNYFGDLYHTYRKNQMDTMEEWKKMFYPSNNDYDKTLDNVTKKTLQIIEKNKKELY